MLSNVFLLVRLAARLSREIPAAVEQDMLWIARSGEPPTTWLLGIAGSSGGEYPWGTVVKQLQGEGGSLCELGIFLGKCGSQIEPN
jgi:hypothetical protein